MSSSPFYKDQNLKAIDLVLISASILGSFILRLELVQFLLDFIPTAAVMMALAWLVKSLVYRRAGLYSRVWAYASMQELKLIMRAATIASLLLTALMLLLHMAVPLRATPKSIYIIDWLLSVMLVGGVRLGLRMLAERQPTTGESTKRPRQVLVVGAGDAGALVVRELQKNPQTQLVPVAFLDDDPEKQGRQIYEVPVVGTLDDLPREIETKLLDEIIVAIPSAPGSVLRQVADVCRRHAMPFRTMPGIYELLGGVVSVSRLRNVDITDLLRREPTSIDNDRMGHTLGGKRILVTGAGGSIAGELCRQLARWGPAELVLVGHGENSIFEILLELEESFPSLSLHPVIADVRDSQRLQTVFTSYQPQVVFHAAAHKHVHLMEMNVEEAVTNNILGTRNVVTAALQHEVERLVMISTDKAVAPTSVMGATKRIAEMLVLDAASRSGRAFSVVRFGNVLGSRGSVVPLFKRQISQGGPVTVRHPDIERYFMTIPEAVHLVLQASALGQNGEMFVLNMGDPVRILNLAEDLIRLSGLEPGEDIEIVFTGMRPGEKLSEELWDKGVAYHPTEHPDINRLDENGLLSGPALTSTVDELARLAQDGDPAAIVQMLDELIPGAAIRSTPPPDFKSIP
ncbi:MAG: polysaccharide biosynthesis protein [Anaerolineae bacterium]|nr:polysaccharide biosynthesis protein [Anaerolineae bacterium]